MASMRPRQACLGMHGGLEGGGPPRESASMRPRQACLGMLALSFLDLALLRASMRPRQACLGMLALSFLDLALLRASMRPRQACLGMPRTPQSPRQHRMRFNEAEASLPRNAEAGPHEACRPREASMRPRQACLGMLPPAQPVSEPSRIASMRPRQACLGMPVPNLCLEWGTPRFNEAEASLPRNAGGRRRNPNACAIGFNEAEASLPRNADRRSPDRAHDCGRFNEAEASLPRNA